MKKEVSGNVNIGERYRHFKGGEYEVVSVAKDSDDLKKIVVYRALYGEGETWVRSFSEFVGYKEIDGENIKRFEKIGEGMVGINVKVKKLREDAVVPEYVHLGDAGMDVVAVSKRVTDKFVEYGTGLAFEVPAGHVMLVFPRSSISKKDLVLANSVGVLDSGYRGELLVRFKSMGHEHYEVGERIAQVMILPYPKVEFEEVEELGETARGEGGFGSTDKVIFK